jgi:hypothetical protein
MNNSVCRKYIQPSSDCVGVVRTENLAVVRVNRYAQCAFVQPRFVNAIGVKRRANDLQLRCGMSLAQDIGDRLHANGLLHPTHEVLRATHEDAGALPIPARTPSHCRSGRKSPPAAQCQPDPQMHRQTRFAPHNEYSDHGAY